MAKIIRLRGDSHHQVQSLLPWFITQTLDVQDQRRVEAHLADCADCRADLEDEQRLRMVWPATTPSVDQGWQEMRRQLNISEVAVKTKAVRRFESAGSWMAWLGRSGLVGAWSPVALAASAGALVVLGAVLSTTPRPAQYHALGAAPVASNGNVLLMFKAGTSETILRQSLSSGHARLVDGPTRAGAYVVAVAKDERAKQLSRWRASADIILAEPIDGGDTP